MAGLSRLPPGAGATTGMPALPRATVPWTRSMRLLGSRLVWLLRPSVPRTRTAPWALPLLPSAVAVSRLTPGPPCSLAAVLR
eukprot:8220739-Alexandrium_andersonii.AAC.1